MRVIQAHPDSFEEVSFDAVTIKDYEKNLPINYRLDFIAEDGIYFILSPKDVIKATPRSFDDHVRWLIDRYHFEQALDDIKNASSANTPKIYTYQVYLITTTKKNALFLAIKATFVQFFLFFKGCFVKLY